MTYEKLVKDGTVSIHSLTQRETRFQSHRLRISGVSIHSLTQRETLSDFEVFLMTLFQSTPSRRGRQCCYGGKSITRGFNPLPHAEGDGNDNKSCGNDNVSIHSLTQRETTETRLSEKL